MYLHRRAPSENAFGNSVVNMSVFSHELDGVTYIHTQVYYNLTGPRSDIQSIVGLNTMMQHIAVTEGGRS